MIIIGEKLNSSIPSACAAMESKDKAAVVALIARQVQAGANYLDINTAVCTDPLDRMLWVIGLVKETSDCGIMIDTTDEALMTTAVEAAAGRALILNSTTIDDRLEWVCGLAKTYHASVVGLPIDAQGMPHTAEEKCQKLDILVERMRGQGLADEQIFLDVLAETLATDAGSAKTALTAIRHVSERYPQVQTTCGLSNVSFGLPKRALINGAFLSAALCAGLTSAIIDPASPAMQDALAAARVVAGSDEYCMEYITHIRATEE